jgi:hypothetical protein
VTVFPVGHYMGERHPAGNHVVRVGLEHQTLDQDEFGVWVLSHGTTEIGKDPWTVDDALALAATAGLSRPQDAIDRLTSVGVLTILPADPIRFARRYRVRPLLVGLGNSEAEPDRYALGLPGLPPMAVVDEPSYELWQWGHLAPSLWHTCEVRAKVATGLGEPTSPTTLLPAVLGDLRVLLTNSAAYLDVTQAN